MRLAVTGKTGQIARALAQLDATDDLTIIPVGRPELDLADPGTILSTLSNAHPDVVISAAAYTAVDQAESEHELAFATNATGAGAVAETANKLGVPVIHISTDYVFDGAKDGFYTEEDRTAALVGVRGIEARRREARSACRSGSCDPAHRVGLFPLRKELSEDDAASCADKKSSAHRRRSARTPHISSGHRSRDSQRRTPARL